MNARQRFPKTTRTTEDPNTPNHRQELRFLLDKFKRFDPRTFAQEGWPTPEELIDEPFTLQRTISMKARPNLDVKRLLEINRAYQHDDLHAKFLLAMLNDRPGTGQNKWLTAIHRSAIRALITEESNKSLYDQVLLRPPLGLSRTANHLLEEFFDEYFYPNRAERVFLATVLETPAMTIEAWFQRKHSVLQPLFSAQKLNKFGSTPMDIVRRREQ